MRVWLSAELARIAAPGARDPELERLEIELLLEAVYRQYGFDFRQYARPRCSGAWTARLDAELLDTLSQLQDRCCTSPPCMRAAPASISRST